MPLKWSTSSRFSMVFKWPFRWQEGVQLSPLLWYRVNASSVGTSGTTPRSALNVRIFRISNTSRTCFGLAAAERIMNVSIRRDGRDTRKRVTTRKTFFDESHQVKETLHMYFCFKKVSKGFLINALIVNMIIEEMFWDPEYIERETHAKMLKLCEDFADDIEELRTVR